GRGSCDAAQVLRDRIAFWSALAEDEGRNCELIGADRPAPVPLPAAELEAAVDALLGNIFRHTPEGTDFAVTLHVGEASPASWSPTPGRASPTRRPPWNADAAAAAPPGS